MWRNRENNLIGAFTVLKCRRRNLKFLKWDGDAVVGGAEQKQPFIRVLYFIVELSGSKDPTAQKPHTRPSLKRPQERRGPHLQGPSFVQGTMVKKDQNGGNALLKQLWDHLLIIRLSEATLVTDCEVAKLEQGFSVDKQYWQEETWSRTGAGAKERNGLMHQTAHANTADG